MCAEHQTRQPFRQDETRPFKPVAGALLRGYKLTLSPLLALFGARCRHAPSCSEFAAEAVSRFGLWRGGWMALARVSRCRPFGTSGVDAVPTTPPRDGIWWRPWRYGRWR